MRFHAILSSLCLFGLSGSFKLQADDPKPISAAAKTVVWNVDRTTAPDSVDELKAMQSMLKSTVDKVMPSTVALLLNQGAGSGAIVSEDGLVLTAAHVIAKPDSNEPYKPNQMVTVILPDGTAVKGRTLGIDRRIDSGMIKITDKPPASAKWPGASEGKWPALELGKSVDLKKGQFVIAMGHPGGPKLNRKPPVRLGQFLNSSTVGRSLRTDCTLVGGDSGGPLFDMSGKLIGIHSRIGLDLETNIHVPIEVYKDEWKRLVAGERIGEDPPVYLGVKFNEKEDVPEVLNVIPESPADNAGIIVGDKITKFDGKKVERANDVYEFLFFYKPTAKVKVEIRRGEETLEVEVVLASRPRERRNRN